MCQTINIVILIILVINPTILSVTITDDCGSHYCPKSPCVMNDQVIMINDTLIISSGKCNYIISNKIQTFQGIVPINFTINIFDIQIMTYSFGFGYYNNETFSFMNTILLINGTYTTNDFDTDTTNVNLYNNYITYNFYNGCYRSNFNYSMSFIDNYPNFTRIWSVNDNMFYMDQDQIYKNIRKTDEDDEYLYFGSDTYPGYYQLIKANIPLNWFNFSIVSKDTKYIDIS